MPRHYALRDEAKTVLLGRRFPDQERCGRGCVLGGRTPFSLGDKLSFQDLNGNELLAVVKKHLFTLFRCQFTVDAPGLDDLEAQGNSLAMEYTFTRGRRVVAEVSKRCFAWSDTYGVDIGDGEDDVLLLASTAVIDMV